MTMCNQPCLRVSLPHEQLLGDGVGTTVDVEALCDRNVRMIHCRNVLGGVACLEGLAGLPVVCILALLLFQKPYDCVLKRLVIAAGGALVPT
jgi:hypothetical protein